MIDNLYDMLNIPKSSRLKVRIPFNQFNKASSISTLDKKIIDSDVDSIYLIGEINSNNCNYSSFVNNEYRYEVIQYLYLKLSSNDKIENIDNIMHKLFPNPIIIIYDNEGEFAISTSVKRLKLVHFCKVI